MSVVRILTCKQQILMHINNKVTTFKDLLSHLLLEKIFYLTDI